jgi:hypothetical protein
VASRHAGCPVTQGRTLYPVFKMSNILSIIVKITTSASIFDLCQTELLIIHLTLGITYHRPITFLKRYTGLFDGKILNDRGLTFTNTANDQQVPRNRADLCYMGAHDGISWASRGDFVTLYPGRAHVVECAIHAINSPNMRAHDEHWSKYMPLLAMAELAGFEDRQMYEVGVSEEAVVHE